MGSTAGVEFTSSLTVRQIADVFQAAVGESRGAGSRFAGALGGGDPEFFTPLDTSPFSSLETDKEDFCVGVHIPKFSGGAKGAVRTVQMFVWDEGASRRVVLVSPHGFGEGRGAHSLIKSFLGSFTSRDAGVRLASEGNFQ